MNQTLSLHQPHAWDANVATYESIAEPFTSRFGSALAERLAIAGGERVIDVAAGSGALALELARSGAQVTAVDHSPGMTRRVAERAAEAGLGQRMAAESMDGQALSFPDGSFDVGLSVFGIMLFPDHEQGLRELVRVVRPGGRVGLGAWRNPEGAAPGLLLRRAFDRIFPDRDRPQLPAGIRTWSEAAGLRSSMSAAGLVRIEVSEIAEDWRFPSLDWVAEHADRLFGIMPIWSEADAGDRESLLGDVLGQLERFDGLAVPSPALLATVEKPA